MTENADVFAKVTTNKDGICNLDVGPKAAHANRVLIGLKSGNKISWRNSMIPMSPNTLIS